MLFTLLFVVLGTDDFQAAAPPRRAVLQLVPYFIGFPGSIGALAHYVIWPQIVAQCHIPHITFYCTPRHVLQFSAYLVAKTCHQSYSSLEPHITVQYLVLEVAYSLVLGFNIPKDCLSAYSTRMCLSSKTGLLQVDEKPVGYRL